MRSWIELFLNFIYTFTCEICKSPLRIPEKIICTKCWNCLEPWKEGVPVRFHALEQLGIRPSFSRVIALFHFTPICRDIIHLLKYDGRHSLAQKLGFYAGKFMLTDPELSRTDLILPVPLHPVKQRERGYNQSSFLVKGMSEVSRIPFNEKVLKRTRYTESQTQYNFLERRKNMEDLFIVNNPHQIRNRTFLVVDDVITSGSTIDACGKALLQAGAREVFALAVTHPTSQQESIGV